MKKVLIITYYWPPSGGGGVQRWLKFVKYLSKFGWTPVVVTPNDPDFEIQDDSLLRDVPTGTEVIKLPIWEPFGLYRKLFGKKAVQKQGVVSSGNQSFLTKAALWVRGNIFIPDPRVFWVRPSVNYLTIYLKKNKIDVVVTTGPPHSVHLIGLELKKRTGIKWLADFRDPWSKWDVLSQLKLSKKSWKHHQRLEKDVLTSADHVLTVSRRLGEELKVLGASDNISVITNGYDVDDFKLIQTGPNDKFQIIHVGLLNTGRNPTELWNILEELCLEVEGFKNDLKVVLAGTIEDSVVNCVNKYIQLQPRVNVVDYISHEEVLQMYEQSAMLLLLVNQTDNAPWILPGKIFEYMMVKRPILALGETPSDANDLLLSAGYKPFLLYSDKSGIKARVLEAYVNYKQNPSQQVEVNVEQYSRQRLTQELSVLLDKID